MTGEHDFDRLERVIAQLMRVGVALSSSVLLAGIVMAFLGMPASPRVLNAGLILLMLIPATSSRWSGRSVSSTPHCPMIACRALLMSVDSDKLTSASVSIER